MIPCKPKGSSVSLTRTTLLDEVIHQEWPWLRGDLNPMLRKPSMALANLKPPMDAEL